MTAPDLTTCFWCGEPCDGKCLGLTESTQMKASDPAYWMLSNGHTSTPTVFDRNCYICRDPEYAQMGVSLCRPCPACTKKQGTNAGHIPADDVECSVCGYEDGPGDYE